MVVTVGVTWREVAVPSLVPLMRNEVAPVALQESVVELPAVIVLGEAEKEEMVGALGAGVTVTVAVAVTEPAELVAVKV